MRKVTLTRLPGDDDSGTFGNLETEHGFKCVTGELPWVDLDGDKKRDRGVSCIAPGTYKCIFAESPSRKTADGKPEWTYRLQDVPDAEGILIHSGNFVGNKAKGYAADAKGCILLGKTVEEITLSDKKRASSGSKRASQKGVTSSKETVSAFIGHMNMEPFDLTITQAA